MINQLNITSIWSRVLKVPFESLSEVKLHSRNYNDDYDKNLIRIWSLLLLCQTSVDRKVIRKVSRKNYSIRFLIKNIESVLSKSLLLSVWKGYSKVFQNIVCEAVFFIQNIFWTNVHVLLLFKSVEYIYILFPIWSIFHSLYILFYMLNEYIT